MVLYTVYFWPYRPALPTPTQLIQVCWVQCDGCNCYSINTSSIPIREENTRTHRHTHSYTPHLLLAVSSSRPGTGSCPPQSHLTGTGQTNSWEMQKLMQLSSLSSSLYLFSASSVLWSFAPLPLRLGPIPLSLSVSLPSFLLRWLCLSLDREETGRVDDWIEMKSALLWNMTLWQGHA